MSTLTPVLIARLATELEMVGLHLKAGLIGSALPHLHEAEKIVEQLREER